jgi:hypothetical protein
MPQRLSTGKPRAGTPGGQYLMANPRFRHGISPNGMGRLASGRLPRRLGFASMN